MMSAPIGMPGMMAVDPVTLAHQRAAALMAQENAKKQAELALAAQKKKSLWGSKRPEEDSQTNASKWANSVSALGDNKRQEKFLKMIGAKGLGPPVNAHGRDSTKVYGTKTQREYEQDLEQQYTQGLMYNVSRSGLGSGT